MNNTQVKGKFRLNVSLINPSHDDVVNYKLVAVFIYDPSTYGNGYSLTIHSISGEHFERYYDLRYDRHFNFTYLEAYLMQWAYSFWSGRNGAWSITKFSLSPLKI